MKRQQNIPNADGSLTLCNAAVQRLLDYGVLHYTDEGFYVGKWPQTNTPTRDSDGTATAAACEDMPVPKDCQARPSPKISSSSGESGHDPLD